MAPSRRRPSAGFDLAPLIIADRFNGPPESAHGGWTAGQLASRVLGPDAQSLGRAAQVTLRHPPPLGARLQLSLDSEATTAEGGVVLTFGGAVIAHATPVELDMAAVDPVSPVVATEAMTRFAGLTDHPYPTCFACGVSRQNRDGLDLRPGPVRDRPRTTATTWLPGAFPADAGALEAGAAGVEAVPAAAVWAALDCPGGWAVEIPGRPLVLGRITAQVDALPLIGECCVVMGAFLGRDGRKAYTATTLYDGDGRALARAAATWIETTGRPKAA